MSKEDFFGKIGNVFSATSKGVADKTREIAGKTKDLADVSKINMKINSERAILEKKYQKIGETYYREYGDTDIEDEQMERLCNSVKESIKIIKEYNKEVQYIKGVPICFLCGKEISNDVFFCKYCGYKTEQSDDAMKKRKEEILKEMEESTESYKDVGIIKGERCSVCKAYCAYEDTFCSICGNQIKKNII